MNNTKMDTLIHTYIHECIFMHTFSVIHRPNLHISVKSAQWFGMNCVHALIRSLCPSRTIEILSPDLSIKIST